MTSEERAAWRALITLGATPLRLHGKHALCLSTVRITSGKMLAIYCQALVKVIGRSGQNRSLAPQYIVTDDPEP